MFTMVMPQHFINTLTKYGKFFVFLENSHWNWIENNSRNSNPKIMKAKKQCNQNTVYYRLIVPFDSLKKKLNSRKTFSAFSCSHEKKRNWMRELSLTRDKTIIIEFVEWKDQFHLVNKRIPLLRYFNGRFQCLCRSNYCEDPFKFYSNEFNLKFFNSTLNNFWEQLTDGQLGLSTESILLRTKEYWHTNHTIKLCPKNETKIYQGFVYSFSNIHAIEPLIK